MSALLFWLLSGVALAGALAVVLPLRRPLHAALALATVAAALAGLFVLLHAPLLGALQLMLHAGTVASILALAVLLLDAGRSPPGARQPLLRLLGALLVSGCALQAVGLLALLRGTWAEPAPGFGSTAGLARLIATDHALVLQAGGLLLLAVLLAGSVLARRSPGP